MIKIIRPLLKKPLSEKSLEGSLFKEKLSRAPATTLAVTPALDAKGRVITGIDETSLKFNAIRDEKDIEAARNTVKAIREELEFKKGEDLSIGSSFWESEEMKYTPYQLKDGDNVFDMEDADQAINFYWLTQLPIIAPSLSAVESGEYGLTTTLFYVYDREDESKAEYEKRKTANEIVSKLNKLSEVKARKVAFMLNLKMSDTSDFADVYTALDDFIRLPKKQNSEDPVAAFRRVVYYTEKTLNVKYLIKNLLDQRIIKLKGDILLEGDNILAKSMEDLEIKLSSDDELYEVYNNKLKRKKNYIDTI